MSYPSDGNREERIVNTSQPVTLASQYRGIDSCDRCGARLQSGEWLGGLCNACEKRVKRTRRATR